MREIVLPPREEIVICFGHPAYQMEKRFEARQTGLKIKQAWTIDTLSSLVTDADVLVVSGHWRNSLLDVAEKLRFIQSIGAGVDQFPLDQLRERGIRLASASGVNSNAVGEHAISLILSLARQLHLCRDNQSRHFWRGMISDIPQREDELGNKTLLIIGMGKIGSRTARLAKAFDMHIVATKRNPETADESADEVHTPDQLANLLPRADYVVLTCPLTPETEKVIDGDALAQMKDSAYLINVARGGCVDEPALLEALQQGSIAGAAIDHFWDEPLPDDSPFWDLENVIITPHTGGETQLYEDRVIDILLENLDRLWRGETALVNDIV